MDKEIEARLDALSTAFALLAVRLDPDPAALATAMENWGEGFFNDTQRARDEALLAEGAALVAIAAHLRTIAGLPERGGEVRILTPDPNCNE